MSEELRSISSFDRLRTNDLPTDTTLIKIDNVFHGLRLVFGVHVDSMPSFEDSSLVFRMSDFTFHVGNHIASLLGPDSISPIFLGISSEQLLVFLRADSVWKLVADIYVASTVTE